VPANVISVILRRIERGDGGPIGPMTSGPSTIDRENNRFKSKAIFANAVRSTV
jgi:hypothetical protein